MKQRERERERKREERFEFDEYMNVQQSIDLQQSRLEATYTRRPVNVTITMFSILSNAKLTLAFNGNKLVGGGSSGGENGGDGNCFEGLHG
jgi:hypothetical protein